MKSGYKNYVKIQKAFWEGELSKLEAAKALVECGQCCCLEDAKEQINLWIADMRK